MKSKPAILFIFVTVMMDMVGLGLVIPTLPKIMGRFSNDPIEIARLFGYFISLYACMQFIASPLLGALSDRYGRRPILLISLFIGAIDYLLMAFAPSLGVLFFGRVISGLSGANVTVAMAYVADVSDPKNQARNFGIVGAAFGLGFIIGPAIGGIVGDMGPQYPFIVAAALTILNFLYGAFVLPESLGLEKRRAFSFKQSNPFKFIHALSAVGPLLTLLVVHFLLHLGGQTHPSIWALYTEYRYQWSPKQIGGSLAVVGLLSAISQGVLTGVMVKKFGEMRAVVLSSFGSAVTFFLFALSSEGWMIFPILIVSSIFWSGHPALQSLITRQAPEDQQGELQGTLVSLMSLAGVLNPFVVTQLFAFFTSSRAPIILPGAPYFFAALACALAFILMFRKNKTTSSNT